MNQLSVGGFRRRFRNTFIGTRGFYRTVFALVLPIIAQNIVTSFVNLLDNETERYLKVTMQVELSEQRTVDELRRLNPMLRDTILDLLTSKTYREMIDPLGKQRLRDEIATRLNMILDHNKGRVNKVYFTEFVIQ